MILKDTILSMERVPLRTLEPEPTYAPPVAPFRAPVDAATPDVRPSPPLIPEPAPLDFETVASWLVGQDQHVRDKLAHMLADDLGQLRTLASREAAAQARTEALAAVKKETETSVAAFAKLAESAQKAFDSETQLLGEHCAEIVAEAITRMAGPILASREAALGVVTGLLARLKDEREVVVRASEGDLAFLQGELAALRAAASGREVSLIADRRVALGGCIVETKLGSLDGRLETQLAGLFDTIRAARAAREEPA